jgi:ribosomal protein S18 acetylase RimI-like enzyme
MTIRPFQMPADADTLLDLIPRSFQYPENESWSIQADEQENLSGSIQTVRRLWPLLRMVQWISPAMRDSFSGFVWEEDGQPVALANVMREGSSRLWMIGNVAVLPDYRRRGIARHLVQACIDLARGHNARCIALDVVAGNDPAYLLYEDLGFVHYTGSALLDILPQAAASDPSEHAPRRARGPSLRLPEGYHLATLDRFDWRTRFDLLRRITPDAVRHYEPVEEGRFQISPLLRPLIPLFARLNGRLCHYYAVRDSGGVVAVAAAHAQRRGGMHQINLSLDPAADSIASPLVGLLLTHLQRISPNRRIEMEVAHWQPAVIAAAEAWGFQRRCDYHRLGLQIR